MELFVKGDYTVEGALKLTLKLPACKRASARRSPAPRPIVSRPAPRRSGPRASDLSAAPEATDREALRLSHRARLPHQRGCRRAVIDAAHARDPISRLPLCAGPGILYTSI
jgi:hypothetical protein